jgi:hypothetical protein
MGIRIFLSLIESRPWRIWKNLVEHARLRVDHFKMLGSHNSLLFSKHSGSLYVFGYTGHQTLQEPLKKESRRNFTLIKLFLRHHSQI